MRRANEKRSFARDTETGRIWTTLNTTKKTLLITKTTEIRFQSGRTSKVTRKVNPRKEVPIKKVYTILLKGNQIKKDQRNENILINT
jgi:hypothetical protein